VDAGPVDTESARVTAGDRLVTAEVDSAIVGLSICYDLRFPELYRALALAGAQILTVPSAFTERTGRDHWEVLLRARHRECRVRPGAIADRRPTRPDGLRTFNGHRSMGRGRRPGT
jgi:predicted amidohydrolase